MAWTKNESIKKLATQLNELRQLYNEIKSITHHGLPAQDILARMVGKAADAKGELGLLLSKLEQDYQAMLQGLADGEQPAQQEPVKIAGQVDETNYITNVDGLVNDAMALVNEGERQKQEPRLQEMRDALKKGDQACADAKRFMERELPRALADPETDYEPWYARQKALMISERRMGQAIINVRRDPYVYATGDGPVQMELYEARHLELLEHIKTLNDVLPKPHTRARARLMENVERARATIMNVSIQPGQGRPTSEPNSNRGSETPPSVDSVNFLEYDIGPRQWGQPIQYGPNFDDYRGAHSHSHSRETPKSSNLFQKPSIPTFEGNRKLYPEFRSVFKAIVEPDYTNNISRAHILKNSLSGRALKRVRTIAINQPNSYSVMFARLDKFYADISFCVQEACDAFGKLRVCDDSDYRGLQRFIDEVCDNHHLLEVADALDAVSQSECDDLIQKLPGSWRIIWFRDYYPTMTPRERATPFKKLVEFLVSMEDFVARLAERPAHRGRNTVRRSDRDKQRAKSNPERKAVNLAQGQDDARDNSDDNYSSEGSRADEDDGELTDDEVHHDQPKRRCAKCKGDHSTVTCADFLILSNRERLKIIRGERACIRCCNLHGNDFEEVCNIIFKDYSKCKLCDHHEHSEMVCTNIDAPDKPNLLP